MAMDKDQYKQLIEQISKMSSTQKEGFVKALGGTAPGGTASTSRSYMGSAVGDLKAAATSGAVEQIKKAFDSLKGPVDQVVGGFSSLRNEFDMLRQSGESFVKAGYSKSMVNFSSAISAAADASYKATGNFKAAEAAIAGLQNNFQAVGFVGEGFRKELFSIASTLEAAGYDTEAYANIVDTATMAFNMSTGEIKQLTAGLVSMQKEFALNPQKLMQDYDYFAKNFAYTTDRLNENFMKLQKMSRTTGVGFQKLAQSFGENMDTFEGSAQMAGRLNQILGKSMFNSIDLLNKTEAERAETIKKGVLERFGNRVGELQKFELKAIGATLGMNADETKRFLRGEAPKAAKDMEKLAKKDPVKVASANLKNEMDGLVDTIRSFQNPYEREMIRMNNALRRGAKSSNMFADGMEEAMRKASAGMLGGTSVGGRDDTSALITNFSQLIERSSRTTLDAAGKIGNVVGGAMKDVIKGLLEQSNERSQRAIAGARDAYDGRTEPAAPLTPTTFVGPPAAPQPKTPDTVFPSGTNVTLTFADMSITGIIQKAQAMGQKASNNNVANSPNPGR